LRNSGKEDLFIIKTKFMTGLERTLGFINGNLMDRPPFHPIIMRWAAKYAGIRYRDFCLDPLSKCKAMIICAKDFEIDWVTVMSDPWAEASAFGIQVKYPEDNLPIDVGGHFPDAVSVSKIRRYNALENQRCLNRLVEIREFKRLTDNELFIVGWIEGPVAEYVDLRKASEASVDFLLDPDSVEIAMDIIIESAKEFISLQIEAGAHCIGIGDAFCSQIGPELYNSFAFNRQKVLVDHIHSCGALAKLHICGNTTSILPSMIATGADIIDVDHQVPSMKEFVSLLGSYQVFSGKVDPVAIIENGTPELIKKFVIDDYEQADRRSVISAGCEITPGTSIRNMKAFALAAKNSIRNNNFY
jgi:MtaA/CmuA family methyltransferase